MAQEVDAAFCPSDKTYAIAAAASAPNAIQIGGPATGVVSVFIFNSGTVPAFVGYASDAATAKSNSVAPTAGNPQQCVVVLAGTGKTYSLAAGQFYSATASSASTVYLTAGYGI